MVAYVHIVTTKPAIEKTVKSLKIPTVQTTKVIRIKPHQKYDSTKLEKQEIKLEPFINYNNVHISNNLKQDVLLNTKIKEEPIDFDFDLNEFDLTKPLTNNNINNNNLDLNLNLLQTVPTSNGQTELNGLVTSEQIFESLGFSEKDLEKYLQEFSPTKFDKNLNDSMLFNEEKGVDNQAEIIKKEPIEHDFKVHLNSLSLQDNRKRRKRNIYRADDVKSEEDLINYLERRKKNNISSKYSRANKKKYYAEMESISEQLLKQNERLRTKSVKLQHLNEYLRNYLIQNYSNNRTLK